MINASCAGWVGIGPIETEEELKHIDTITQQIADSKKPIFLYRNMWEGRTLTFDSTQLY